MIKLPEKHLVTFLRGLIEDAKEDKQFSIAWFGPTIYTPFSIIGGWMSGFSEDYGDILCISKSDPSYAMCVKIVVNDEEGQYAYTDFEIMDMPINAEGDVDDTCIALDYDEDVASLARFLICEWERIMKEHGGAE